MSIIFISRLQISISSTAVHTLPIILRKIIGPDVSQTIGILTRQVSSPSPAALALKTDVK